MKKISKQRSTMYLPLKLAAIYGIFSVLWILLSDRLLLFFVKNPEFITEVQILKGWLFVLVTAIIIYFLIRQELKKGLQTEAVLRESEKKLQAIFNHRFQLTGLLSSDGKVLMANDTACNMVGVDFEELEGENFWELPHWAHSRELQNKIQSAVHAAQKGKVVDFETTHHDSKGNILFVYFSMTPVRNESGEVIFIVPEGQDITEKKQSENRLIESERNYREIYNSSSDAILIHDAKTGKIVDVNQTMLDMYGYTYQETLQLDIEDIGAGGPDFSQKQALKKVKKAIAEKPQLFEWFARRKNGSNFWVEVSLRNTTIGGKGRVLAVVRDITERKRLDAELRLVKHSIEHNAYPFEWIQKDGRFFYVNEAGCHDLGYTKEEICSMRVSDIDPDFPVERWPRFWEKLKAEKTLIFETRHRRQNGEIFPVEMTANHLEFEGQEHVFAYVKDISDRIHYENERRQLEKQLQQTQKMEVIGTLAGGIAHDFNNILSAILGYAEMVELSLPPDSPARDWQQQVIKAGLRAKDLVQQILLFSRQTDHERKPVQPHLVVKEALKLLRSSIPATIEMRQNIEPNCGSILADPTQMHQIIMNLCTNAYHAMRESGGVLEINLSKLQITKEDIGYENLQLDPGTYIRLEIRDTGHGMDQVTKEKIFNPYFTTKPRGEGTGLGLSVVLAIVENSGGNIAIFSEPEKGTSVHVYFPRLETEVEAIELQKGELIPTGNERVLVVDDEKVLSDMIKESLGSLGYKVIAHTSSQDALALFKTEPDMFDIVITNMTMPHMNGLEMAKQMFAAYPKIPVILCTGFSDLITHEKTLDFNIQAVLTKPVLIKELSKTIRKIIDNGP